MQTNQYEKQERGSGGEKWSQLCVCVVYVPPEALVRLSSISGNRIEVAVSDSLEILIPLSKRQIGKQKEENEIVKLPYKDSTYST